MNICCDGLLRLSVKVTHITVTCVYACRTANTCVYNTIG